MNQTSATQAQSSCGSDSHYPAGRYPIQVNQAILVVHSPNFDPINLRSAPGLSSEIIWRVPQHVYGQILDGPIDLDGYRWWEVDISASWTTLITAGESSFVGWLAQGTADCQWIAGTGQTMVPGPPNMQDQRPNAHLFPGNCQGGSRMADLPVNTWAKVNPAAVREVKLYARPQKDPIQTLTSNTKAEILDGPYCDLGQNGALDWYLVQLENGTQGWVNTGYADEPSRLVEAHELTEQFVIGWDQPQSVHYGYVPYVINPHQLLARESFDADSQIMATITPGYYYSLLNANEEWSLIGNVVGPIGWVRTGIMQIGTTVENVEADLSTMINDGASASFYNETNLPAGYKEAQYDLLERWGNNTADIISRTYAVYEIFGPSGGNFLQRTRTAVCLVVEVTSGESDLDATIELGCAIYEVTDFIDSAVKMDALAIHVKVSEVAFRKLGPFVRWNDRVWMDSLNRKFGSCPITTLLYGRSC